MTPVPRTADPFVLPASRPTVRSTLSPNIGRIMVPSALPANAAGSHIHPCRLPDAMPLK